jgi:hypothetical protein
MILNGETVLEHLGVSKSLFIKEILNVNFRCYELLNTKN